MLFLLGGDVDATACKYGFVSCSIYTWTRSCLHVRAEKLICCSVTSIAILLVVTNALAHHVGLCRSGRCAPLTTTSPGPHGELISIGDRFVDGYGNGYGKGTFVLLQRLLT